MKIIQRVTTVLILVLSIMCGWDQGVIAEDSPKTKSQRQKDINGKKVILSDTEFLAGKRGDTTYDKEKKPSPRAKDSIDKGSGRKSKDKSDRDRGKAGEPKIKKPIKLLTPPGYINTHYHKMLKGQSLRQIARFYYGGAGKAKGLMYYQNLRGEKAGVRGYWRKPLRWHWDSKLWLTGTLIRIDNPVRIVNAAGKHLPGYRGKKR